MAAVSGAVICVTVALAETGERRMSSESRTIGNQIQVPRSVRDDLLISFGFFSGPKNKNGREGRGSFNHAVEGCIEFLWDKESRYFVFPIICVVLEILLLTFRMSCKSQSALDSTWFPDTFKIRDKTG